MYKVQISRNQHYSCLRCGWCCRRFRVRIDHAEMIRIKSLDWGDEPHPEDFCEIIGGHYYFRRKADGGCVFLDDSGVCMIHRKFGYDMKALTCRGYPMNIISVWPGELSVLARMDCPAVLSNNGQPLKSSFNDIQHLVQEMTFGNGFTVEQCCGLERPAVEFLSQCFRKAVLDRQFSIRHRMLWLMCFVARCEDLGAPFINDLSSFKEVYATVLAQAARDMAEMRPQKLGMLKRTDFRNHLALYCRRDEECLNRSVGARLKRFWWNMGFIFGHTSWQRLGDEHPDISSRQARLFSEKLQNTGNDDVWQPFLEFLVNRVDTLQYFGVAFYGCNLYHGLRALILCFPLAMAIAKVHARAAKRNELTRDDVFKAVLAIDHSHGRSPALNGRLARMSEIRISRKWFMSLVWSM